MTDDPKQSKVPDGDKDKDKDKDDDVVDDGPMLGRRHVTRDEKVLSDKPIAKD